MRAAVTVLAVTAVILVGCAGDERQRQACERLLPAFEHAPDEIILEGAERGEFDRNEVTITYISRDTKGPTAKRWLTCRFASGAFGRGRLDLIGVATDRHGSLNPIELHILKIWQRLEGTPRSPPRSGPASTGPGRESPLYVLQQLVNATVPCSIYALIALGFSLVHRIIGGINFAFGDIATMAGLVAFVGLTLAAAVGGGSPLAWLAMICAGIAVAAAWGYASERLAFRRLVRRDGQRALIAAIGLAMAMREAQRLAQGSGDVWLQPVITRRWLLAHDAATAVSVTAAQLTILAAAALACALVVLVIRRGRFGRNYRACCDDRRMAALLGIPVGRTVAITFVLGGALAGVAGLISAVYYGTVGAYGGIILGFKAMVAAVLGGFGSLAGAIVGGIVVGMMEQLWSTYVSFGSRDLLVFGVLAAVLVLRPRGLFGADHRRQPDRHGAEGRI